MQPSDLKAAVEVERYFLREDRHKLVDKPGCPTNGNIENADTLCGAEVAEHHFGALNGFWHSDEGVNCPYCRKLLDAAK